MSREAASSGNAGFTLVEALLATLLMGLILTALATVTAQWMPSWDRGVARLQRIEALGVGLDRLIADIAAAEDVTAGTGVDASGASVDAPIFDGGELAVVFVRTTLSPNAVTGLEVVRIAETTDDRGPVVARSTAPFSPGMGGARDAEAMLFTNPVSIIRAPLRLSFSYSGPDRVWQPTWHGKSQLPRAVRVRLRDLATSETLAVSTSTIIHAELPAHCTWAKSVAECPVLAGQASSSGSQGNGMLGGQ